MQKHRLAQSSRAIGVALGLLACASSSLATGCALDRKGVALGRLDAAVAIDARVEVDAVIIAPLDAAPLDAGTSDAPVAIDAGTEPLCTGDELVACYPLDGDADDHSGRGNHLRDREVMFPAAGGALLGATSELSRADRRELDLTRWTLEAWVRLDADVAVGRVAIADRDGQYGLFVYPGGEVRCALNVAGLVVTASAPEAVRAALWQHVGCVHDGETLTVYVDGIGRAAVSATGAITDTNSELRVGENAPDGLDQLIGRIDDLRIWDAARSPTQMAASYARGRILEP